jgi:hypothetical protein
MFSIRIVILSFNAPKSCLYLYTGTNIHDHPVISFEPLMNNVGCMIKMIIGPHFNARRHHRNARCCFIRIRISNNIYRNSTTTCKTMERTRGIKTLMKAIVIIALVYSIPMKHGLIIRQLVDSHAATPWNRVR